MMLLMMKSLLKTLNIILKNGLEDLIHLYYAEELNKEILVVQKIYFKSDHLNHLGAHKINNASISNLT